MSWLPLVLELLVSVFAIGLVIITGRSLLKWYWLVTRSVLSMEITPPLTGKRTAQATEQLFVVLHGLGSSRSLLDRLLGRPTLISCKIIASRDKGIRYVISVDANLIGNLEQLVHAYLSAAKTTLFTEETILPDDTVIQSYKSQSHFAFPLAAHVALEEHDPLTYVTNAMANLDAGEGMVVQLIMSPVRLREAGLLARKILGNEDIIGQLGGHRIPLIGNMLGLLSRLMLDVTELVGTTYHGATYSSYKGNQNNNQQKLQIARRDRPARTLSAFELELMESMHHKLNQPLFAVSIGVAVVAKTKTKRTQRLSAVRTALGSYHTPGYQSLRKVRLFLPRRLRIRAFKLQLPNHSSILSASEVGSLYHIPLAMEQQVDNLAMSLSKTLAAPISLKQGQDLDIVLGENHHHGRITPIGLSAAERERHIYIIGGTGNGKTTMLQYGIVQDMQAGKGLAVIDPHGDMAETLLQHVPANRIDDVVYFNPDDIAYPIGLNILEVPPDLTGDELLREKDLITESVISIFRKIFSDDDSGGHRVEYVLRNTIQTALTVPDATLFTIFDLLNNPGYRKKVIAGLDNEDLKNFWKHELGKAGEMQRVKMAAGITAKVGRFLFSASAKRILEQPKSTIDFDEIINSGEILICNFSKGLLGEDTSELFGITVLAKLQLASLRRARITQTERQPFFLYVDEFQNFATQTFVQMLSESRKYKLFMIMAEQSTSQQKDKDMINVVLANTGTVLSFRTGNPEDERMLLPLFKPFVEEGEIANLPPYNFYARLSATKSQEPLSGNTLLLEQTGSSVVAHEVIERSRLLYAAKPLPLQESAKIENPPKAKKNLITKSSVPSPEDVLQSA
jgi:hypothetical protein